MFSLKIISQGEDLATFSRNVTRAMHFELQSDLDDVGKETHQFMQQNIVSQIKRPFSTGNLVRAIKYEWFDSGFEFGFFIGDIDYLNQTAKQWRWLNYGKAGTGRTIPPGTNENPRIRGEFIPSGLGRFQKGGFPMNPTKPMPAYHYIDNTIHFLEDRLPKVMEMTSGTMGKYKWVGAWGKWVKFHQKGEDIS